MKEPKRISIIVPVYNVALYLAECINSILTQTFKDYEIILVDDGSSDISGSLCDQFANIDERISVIHQENKGLSAARNAGVHKASGQYIIFLDSDDYWKDKDVLQILAERLRLTEADVISFNYEKTDGVISQSPYFQTQETMPRSIRAEESFKYQIDHDLWIACAWNKVIRRELFNRGQLQFRGGITSEDIDWCVRLALIARSFDYINCVVVCYRQRNGSISKTVTYNKASTLLKNIKFSLKLIKDSKNTDRGQLLKSYISYQYGTLLYCINAIKEKEKKKQIMEEAEKYRKLLTWSKNRKIKLLRTVDAIGGLKTVDILLSLRNILTK